MLSYFSFWSYYIYFISIFASLIDISKGIMSSTTGLNIYAITPRIKKYKSITQKKREVR